MLKPYRVGIVGLGGISTAWIDALLKMPDVKIVGLADLNIDQINKQIQKYGLTDVVIGLSPTEIIEKSEINIICDCTIPSAHRHVSAEAMNAGVHVLVEKPLADSLSHGIELCALANKTKKKLGVMQNRRFDPNLLRLRELITSGTLGSINEIHADFFIGAHFGGFRDEMEHVLLQDMAIHTFDAARFLTSSDPMSVYCTESNPKSSWYFHGASANAIFKMTNDINFTYRGSWCAEGLPTSWESSWRIIGEKGTAIWYGAKQIQIEVVSGNEGFTRPVTKIEIPPYLNSAPMGHAGIIREFLDSINSGALSLTNSNDNIKSLAMVYGAIESATNGVSVPIRWE